MAHIKLHDVAFRFDSRTANSLDDISLNVNHGECLLLAGRSGSGKSTLLHVLSGLVPEYYQGDLQGCIRVGNEKQRWQEVPLWQKAASVGTVFQDPRHQFFSARVEQELLLSESCRESGYEESGQLLHALLNNLGLQKLRHRLLDTLSSGEQQRVAIGTAISLSPPVLVLDEPSANLSADGIAILLQFLQGAKEKGTTIVIAEHRFSWLRPLVDQLVVLEKGNIVHKGNGDKLNDHHFCEQFGLRFQPFHDQKDVTKNDQSSRRNGSFPLFSMDQVGFRHGKKEDWLLRRLSRKFYSGEVVALTGKNGCGKTTLLSLLFGLHKSGEGMITFADSEASKSLALQHPDLQLFASTVAEEVSPDDNERDKWLNRFNLEQLKDCHPLTLSGGEMQRLVLAAAFARVNDNSNATLLLDEPTSGMDGEQLGCLVKEIEKLSEQGGSIVMATHDPELLQETGAVIMEMG